MTFSTKPLFHLYLFVRKNKLKNKYFIKKSLLCAPPKGLVTNASLGKVALLSGETTLIEKQTYRHNPIE